MSLPHHGDCNENEALKRLRDQLTGRADRAYSQGRVSMTDDGDLSYAIAADLAKGIVIIDFTKPVEWLGLDVRSCRNMAQLLIEQANNLEKDSKNA